MDRNEIISRLREHREALNRDYGVTSIGVFGSAARNELRPDSDIDLLVEFAPDRRIGLFGFVQLQR
jgi:predicted nucleotidyltransferase